MNPAPPSRSRSAVRPYTILLAVVAAAFFITRQTTKVDAQAVAGVRMELPERIGEWTGRPAEVQPIERQYLGEDTEFARKIYRRTDGHEIFLGIVLSGKDRSSIHAPEACLRGQGWDISGAEVLHVAMDRPHPYDLPVMKYGMVRQRRAPDGSMTRLTSWYLFWFVGRDRLTTSNRALVLWTSWDLIFRNINPRWAYVAVMVTVPPGREKETEEMVKKFIQEATPTFQKTSG